MRTLELVRVALCTLEITKDYNKFDGTISIQCVLDITLFQLYTYFSSVDGRQPVIDILLEVMLEPAQSNVSTWISYS